MADPRTFVIKNSKRLPTVFNGEPTDVVEEFITRHDSNGVSHPVGFSQEQARSTAELLGLDPDEDVIVAPDDIVVVLDDSARKLPRGNEPVLNQFREGIRTV